MSSRTTGGVAELFDLGLWSAWLSQIDREFAFLLLLPFVVAVIGLWASYREKDDDRDRD
jgi:hypothetical protein